MLRQRQRRLSHGSIPQQRLGEMVPSDHPGRAAESPPGAEMLEQAQPPSETLPAEEDIGNPQPPAEHGGRVRRRGLRLLLDLHQIG